MLDKSFGPSIEVARKQWSGNKTGVISAIGVVSCVYVDSQTECFWVVDYRIFDPDTHGKRASSIMSKRCCVVYVEHRRLPFRAVLMDTWYATKDSMLLIDGMKKMFYVLLAVEEQPPSSR